MAGDSSATHTMSAPAAAWIWLGIRALVQPLIGERVFGTLKPNRVV